MVVVNHHLLFADMAIKQRGFGEVLPGAEAFVIDEAHQAPELASRFFSSSLSARQLNDLCRDILAEAGELAGALGSLREPVQACQQALREFQALLGERLAGTRPLAAIDVAAWRCARACRNWTRRWPTWRRRWTALEGASRGLDACRERRAERAGAV